MRAQQLHQPAPIEAGPLHASELPAPSPGPGEVRVRVAACGVCRTDLQLVEGDLALRARPVVPGHQAVGRVVEVGSEVAAWQVGERAGVAWLASTCGTCPFCTSDRENLCELARFTGWDRDGGYADELTVRADFAIRLPDGPSDLDLAPLLCGGVIGYRALKVCGIEPGGRLGLFGFGASALLAIQIAVHWGCSVYVATRSKSEQDRAIELGAVWAGGYDEQVPVPLDGAVTFAPAGSVVIAALRALDRGGIVAVNAIHLDNIPAFDYGLLWWERQIRSVANFTRRDAEELMRLAAEIPIRTVVDPAPLSDANRALARLKSGDVRGAAVLVPDPP